MIKFSIVFICSHFVVKSFAQNIGNLKTMTRDGNTLPFIGTSVNARIRFCTEGMFSMTYTWKNAFENDEPWMVTKYTWPAVNFTSADKKDFVEVITAKLNILSVTIQKPLSKFNPAPHAYLGKVRLKKIPYKMIVNGKNLV